MERGLAGGVSLLGEIGVCCVFISPSLATFEEALVCANGMSFELYHDGLGKAYV